MLPFSLPSNCAGVNGDSRIIVSANDALAESVHIKVGVVESVIFWEIVAKRYVFREPPGEVSFGDAVEEGSAVGLRGQVENVRKAGERRLGKSGDILRRVDVGT